MNHSSDSGEDVGEDQEDSSFGLVANVEDALTSFREQWQRELEISPKKDLAKNYASKAPSGIPLDDDATSTENKARKLFLEGIEHEQNGKLYEAIQFYKRAVQLVPDIEFRLYESSKVKPREKFESDERLETQDGHSRQNEANDNNENDEEDDSELCVKLSRIIYRNQCVCFPRFEQSGTHISALPMEIVLYILRWVVSSELDLRSLEMFSGVCRGFYISARDAEIWRLACVRVWGVNCGTHEPKYQSWREMYLQRPRLRYNGCYISKTTYIRHGENSFQDQFYRPWHLVEYFRYLRFFPEGRVLMLTSAEEMQTCVNSLKNRIPRNSSVLIGHYRLHDDRVTLILKKQETKGSNNAYRKKRREPMHDSGEQTFHVEFSIQNHQKRVNSQLTWLRYNIFTKYRNGQEGNMYLNLSGRYPPFKFSRVKSYTLESEAPLQ
ncbi:F-box only protein 9 isoform X2 [Cephus cinctus]|uniref:F-box only protein 9 n=1 Tax=Cephus cinctus TaxID=211228 RepID=A0AAJ7FEW8_CEPCN|nr:F-box only protein 9 isoform X2 [Cephus cinctus]